MRNNEISDDSIIACGFDHESFTARNLSLAIKAIIDRDGEGSADINSNLLIDAAEVIGRLDTAVAKHESYKFPTGEAWRLGSKKILSELLKQPVSDSEAAGHAQDFVDLFGMIRERRRLNKKEIVRAKLFAEFLEKVAALGDSGRYLKRVAFDPRKEIPDFRKFS
jgi:hypothetical protein